MSGKKLTGTAKLKATIAELEARESGRLERDEKQNKQYDDLQKIGNCAMDSIRGMVAAVECDYDRLEELRDKSKNDATCDSCDYEGPCTTCPECVKPTIPPLDEEEAEELKGLEEAAGDCASREDAETRIQEDPLSLEYRSGWTSPGDKMEAEEFCLLLSTGGPATRIVGELRNGEAYRCRLEAQDWYTPWTECRTSDSDILETYCNIVGVGAGVEC